MKTLGLIGYPLGHSFSKKYFQDKFLKEKIDWAEYINLEIQDLKPLRTIISDKNILGLNVTIPHKKEILKYVDHHSSDVDEIGSANTLKIINNEIFAYNTDWRGFKESLNSTQLNFDKQALILGTGGASLAVKYALNKMGISFQIVSRNASKGDFDYSKINNSVLDRTELIINTSPLGMEPKIETCPDLPYNLINANHFCYDLVYNPEKTLFLEKSEQNGAKIKNGYEMLVLQAEESWKIWNS